MIRTPKESAIWLTGQRDAMQQKGMDSRFVDNIIYRDGYRDGVITNIKKEIKNA